jgi:hypothetical protein
LGEGGNVGRAPSATTGRFLYVATRPIHLLSVL